MFSSEESKWQHIKFYIFDVLKNKGTLEDRFSFLKQHKFTDRVQLLTYTKCEGISHLRDKWHQLSREGGRAILLRKPRSRYNPSDANHYNTLLRVQVLLTFLSLQVNTLTG
jgi:ATP-dependent DNA ligase